MTKQIITIIVWNVALATVAAMAHGEELPPSKPAATSQVTRPLPRGFRTLSLQTRGVRPMEQGRGNVRVFRTDSQGNEVK